MSSKYTLLPSLARVVANPLSEPPDKTTGDVSSSSDNARSILKKVVEKEEERELGLSDMTETEASESDEDDSKLVIDDASNKKVLSNTLDSSRVRSLAETMKFLEGNKTMKQDKMMVEDEESYDEESDNEIVVSSSGAPDKYGFLTEIYVPKMRGFEDLSDRCILDSVSVNLTLDQVVRSNMDQFNSYMRNTDLTDTQREITKYVRRRARNRVSARKSRMKKISDIVRLSQEIKVIRQKKDSLKHERMIMEKLKVSWNNRVSVLEDFILKYLREHGEKTNIKLEYKENDVIVVEDENKSENVKSTTLKKNNPKKIFIKSVQVLNNEFNKKQLFNKRTLLIVKNNASLLKNKDSPKTPVKQSESIDKMDSEVSDNDDNELHDYLLSKLQENINSKNDKVEVNNDSNLRSKEKIDENLQFKKSIKNIVSPEENQNSETCDKKSEEVLLLTRKQHTGDIKNVVENNGEKNILIKLNTDITKHNNLISKSELIKNSNENLKTNQNHHVLKSILRENEYFNNKDNKNNEEIIRENHRDVIKNMLGVVKDCYKEEPKVIVESMIVGKKENSIDDFKMNEDIEECDSLMGDDKLMQHISDETMEISQEGD